MEKKERNVVIIIFAIVAIATFALETHNDNESKRMSKQVKELEEAKRIQDSLKVLKRK